MCPGTCFCRCLVALVAQFYPGKLEDSWWPIAGCVALYFVLTGALNLFTWRWEGSAFLFLHASEVAVPSDALLHLCCLLSAEVMNCPRLFACAASLPTA